MEPSAHYTTAPEDRIPLPHKIAYALGMLVNNLQAASLGAMAIILNLGLKMDPRLVGMLGFAPRLFDAATDPMMGYISDNTRSRFGRRRPYILLGAISSGIIFALMWQMREGRSESFYFWYFMIASMGFFLAYTIYATPFIALGYEMTPDYHERTRLQGFSNVIGQLAWIAAPWFYVIMQNQRYFTNEVHGARTLAIIVGGFILVVGLAPALCREPFSKIAQAESEKTKHIGFWAHCWNFFKGIGITFKRGPFVKLCAATFLVFNGYQLGATFTLYVYIYYLYGGDKAKAGVLQGWIGSVTSICTFCLIPLITWVSTKIGKRRTFLITTLISMVGYGLKWFCYDPEHPYLLLITAPFISFGIGALFTLMSAMVADVCDYDELSTGQRREGTFGAIYWWMIKVGMSIALLISGFMLTATGFDVELGTNQPPQTPLLLKVFDVTVPLVSAAIALLVMFTYNIDERRAREIRAELEQRRGKTSQTAA
ncbi:MAG: MFS transporter [Planctomycetaceae bacterium]|nr:MFS transporter [Planctomycetaceae bacterium]